MAVPGGIGTLEELIEVYTRSQLGIHHKPCGVLNLHGYYDHLAAFLDRRRNPGATASRGPTRPAGRAGKRWTR